MKKEKIVTVRVSEGTYNMLYVISKKMDISISQTVRMIIQWYKLNEMEVKE